MRVCKTQKALKGGLNLNENAAYRSFVDTSFTNNPLRKALLEQRQGLLRKKDKRYFSTKDNLTVSWFQCNDNKTDSNDLSSKFPFLFSLLILVVEFNS